MGRRSVQSSGLPRVPGLQGSPGFPGSGGVQGALCVPPQGSGKQILELENPGGPGENTHTTTAGENKAAAQFRANPSQKSQAEGRSKLPGQKTDRSRRQRQVGFPGWENRAEFRQVRVQESEKVGADW